ncbi:hypothetical protein BTA15_19900 [Vibrio parahaemolyticus]|uniref:hypothetical protein n=1 Tax=Vibrio harveyi group TaxID=717610 RepID=UPI000A37031C|nr:hypothetical protein [Vibrio parahaemolyticus]OUD49860.1 hypothetical protein BTA15_19900 [Vibrio parahaemolyticus]HCG6653615.1 hypothetical protein [Vibrio parahaemolyticus]
MRLVGLKVFNKDKVLKGKVTQQYTSSTDDREVLLINDDYEICIDQVDYILFTLKPDERGEHLRIK